MISIPPGDVGIDSNSSANTSHKTMARYDVIAIVAL